MLLENLPKPSLKWESRSTPCAWTAADTSRIRVNTTTWEFSLARHQGYDLVRDEFIRCLSPILRPYYFHISTAGVAEFCFFHDSPVITIMVLPDEQTLQDAESYGTIVNELIGLYLQDLKKFLLWELNREESPNKLGVRELIKTFFMEK